MKQYQEAAAKGGNIARKAQAELIADSILKEDGEPLFKDARKLYETMGKMRTRRYASLLAIISQHNGANDEVRDAEAEAEQEKKSDG